MPTKLTDQSHRQFCPGPGNPLVHQSTLLSSPMSFRLTFTKNVVASLLPVYQNNSTRLFLLYGRLTIRRSLSPSVNTSCLLRGSLTVFRSHGECSYLGLGASLRAYLVPNMLMIYGHLFNPICLFPLNGRACRTCRHCGNRSLTRQKHRFGTLAWRKFTRTLLPRPLKLLRVSPYVVPIIVVRFLTLFPQPVVHGPTLFNTAEVPDVSASDDEDIDSSSTSRRFSFNIFWLVDQIWTYYRFWCGCMLGADLDPNPHVGLQFLAFSWEKISSPIWSFP